MKKILSIIISVSLIISCIPMSFMFSASAQTLDDSDILKSNSTFLNEFVNWGNWTLDGEKLSSNGTGSSIYLSKSAPTEIENIITDFDIKFANSLTGTITIRLRYLSVDGNTYGCYLNIDKSNISLYRYTGSGNNYTLVATKKFDFTKTTTVRIIANGSNLSIALDGKMCISFDEFYTGVAPSYFNRYYPVASAVELSNINVYTYSEARANDGITGSIVDDNDLLRTNAEISQSLVTTSSLWTYSGDAILSGGSSGKTALINPTNIENFIFNFNIKFTEEATGGLTIRFRLATVDGNANGYFITFSKSSVVLKKYTGSAWGSEQISFVTYDFTNAVDVRISANSNNLFLALDGYKYIILNDAYSTSGSIYFNAGFPSVGDCQLSNLAFYNYNSAKSEDGILGSMVADPDLLRGHDDLASGLIEYGNWIKDGDTIVSGVSGGKSSSIASSYIENFIFNFNIKYKIGTTGAVSIRLRYSDDGTNAQGYIIQFFAGSVVLNKYTGSGWKTEKITSVEYDFSESTDVRIVANSNNLIVALGGYKYIILDDAYSAKSNIYFNQGYPSEGGCTLSKMEFYKYSEEKAENGLSLPPETDVLVPAISALSKFNGYSWKLQEDKTLVSTKPSGSVTLAEINDFVLDFDLNIAPKELGELTVRIRHSYDSTRNYGYKLGVSGQKITVAKYNEVGFGNSSVKCINSDTLNTLHFRISACGDTITFRVNNDVIYTITDAYNDSNKIMFTSSLSEGNAVLSNIILREYSVEAENEEVVVKQDAKIVSKPLIKTTTALKLFGYSAWNIEDTSATATDGSSIVSFCNTKDFIINLNAQLQNSDESNLLINFRHNFDTVNNGYTLKLENGYVSLSKYIGEANGNLEVLKSANVDFTSGKDIRISATGSTVTISFDNTKYFEITDAVDIVGFIEVDGDLATVTDFNILTYTKDSADADLNDTEITEETTRLVNPVKLTDGFVSTELEGENAFVFADSSKGKELHLACGLENFVLKFNTKLDDNVLTVNFRKNSFTSGNYSEGYRLDISNSDIILKKYNGTDFTSKTLIAQSDINLDGWFEVRIIALDGNLTVLADECVMLEATLDYLNKGCLSVQNTLSDTQEIYISKIMLTEFYSDSANEHPFVNMVAGAAYLKEFSQDNSQGTYYYSCRHGKKGTEVFTVSMLLKDIADINTDKKQDILDLIRLKKNILNQTDYSIEKDLNRDGTVSALDLVTLKQYHLGIKK